MNELFANNWKYLEAELAHLDLLIKTEVARFRMLVKEERPDPFRGIYISEAEVDSLTGGEVDSAAFESAAWRERADEFRQEIWQRRLATLENGTSLLLPKL